jgi:hypothetical protein
MAITDEIAYYLGIGLAGPLFMFPLAYYLFKTLADYSSGNWRMFWNFVLVWILSSITYLVFGEEVLDGLPLSRLWLPFFLSVLVLLISRKLSGGQNSKK